MSQPSTSRAASPRRAWPKWVVNSLWGILIALATALFVFIATLMFGGVHGMEFSPQTFERRTYSFYELPLVGIQVTAIRHDDLTGIVETFLMSNKYVAGPPATQQDWHIVIGSRGTKMFRKGDANILMQYLDAKDAGDYHRWVKWSEDNPKLAKVLWPSVQRLAKDELYVFIPDLFEQAKRLEDPVKLQLELNRQVAERLLFLGRRLQEREEHSEAIKLLDEAAKLDPANKEIPRARDTSRAAVGSGKENDSKPAKKS